MSQTFDQIDLPMLKQAVSLSRLCPRQDTAFSVGCVIVLSGQVVATGYSREWGESWHAEAVALEKARSHSIDLSSCILYSSLEPCSVRKSGGTSCCDLIKRHGIKRVVFGMREPPIFVDGKGAETLMAANIEVLEMDAVLPEVVSINAHLAG